MRMIKGQKGLSLVEVTIMLLVLMLLTSVLAPSIWDFVHDAQWVKVKEDCEAIGISFSRLTRDIGPCLRGDAAQPCDINHRVDVLKSFGNTAGGGTAVVAIANMASTDWNAAGANALDTMDNQFVTNASGYNTPLQNYPTTYPVGPHFGLGWRGAYLAPPIGPDPWGTAYYVNSGFNAVAVDAGVGEGGHNRWWETDVICISVGPNQTFDTTFKPHMTGPYTSWGTSRGGDDFTFVISGSGR